MIIVNYSACTGSLLIDPKQHLPPGHVAIMFYRYVWWLLPFLVDASLRKNKVIVIHKITWLYIVKCVHQLGTFNEKLLIATIWYFNIYSVDQKHFSNEWVVLCFKPPPGYLTWLHQCLGCSESSDVIHIPAIHVYHSQINKFVMLVICKLKSDSE